MKHAIFTYLKLSNFLEELGEGLVEKIIDRNLIGLVM